MDAIETASRPFQELRTLDISVMGYFEINNNNNKLVCLYSVVHTEKSCTTTTTLSVLLSALVGLC